MKYNESSELYEVVLSHKTFYGAIILCSNVKNSFTNVHLGLIMDISHLDEVKLMKRLGKILHHLLQ